MAPVLLIVDDEPHLLRLLVRVFERAGYTVVAVQDGESAVAELDARAGAIDVVVLDVFIPPEGAEAVLDAIPTGVQDAGLVMVSGDALGADLSKRLEERGGLFVRKPFLPDALVDAVRSVTPGAGSSVPRP